MTLFEIRDEALSVDEVTAAVAHPSAGGTSLFIGTVRDENDHLPITLLEHEAYASMAVKQMREIGDEIAAEIPGTRVAVLHRVGRLEVGDLAILFARARPTATRRFEPAACSSIGSSSACRLERVHGPEGPYWVGFKDARCTGRHDHVD